jgi:hypothetical protein
MDGIGTLRRLFLHVMAVAVVIAGALVIWAQASNAAGGGTKLWVARYNAPPNGNDFANSVAAAPDGSKVFVTGSTKQGQGYGNDFTTIAYSPITGAQLWSRVYNSGGANYDRATTDAVSPDGTTVFVAGPSFKRNAWTTIAYSALTGAQLWLATFPVTTYPADDAQLAVRADGHTVFMTARDFDTQFTIAYSTATGTQLWKATLGGLSGGTLVVPSQRRNVAATCDNTKVLVTTTGFSATQGTEYLTVAYDASSGAALWSSRYNGTAGAFDDFSSGLAISPDGSRVVVTGTTADGSQRDYGTVAYDTTTGTQLWAARYDSTFNDTPAQVVLSPAGDKAYITGNSTHLEGTLVSEYRTVAYDTTTGTQVWDATLSSPGTGATATAIGATEDGSKVLVTGWRWVDALRGNDFTAVAYDDTSGAQLWMSGHNFSTDDESDALVVVPGSTKVVLAGSTSNTQNTDYMTEGVAI